MKVVIGRSRYVLLLRAAVALGRIERSILEEPEEDESRVQQELEEQLEPQPEPEPEQIVFGVMGLASATANGALDELASLRPELSSGIEAIETAVQQAFGAQAGVAVYGLRPSRVCSHWLEVARRRLAWATLLLSPSLLEASVSAVDGTPIEVLATIGALLEVKVSDADAHQGLCESFAGDGPATTASVSELASYIDKEMFSGWNEPDDSDDSDGSDGTTGSSLTGETWISNTFGSMDALGSVCLTGLRHTRAMIDFGAAFWWKTEQYPREGLFVVIAGCTD